MRAGDHRGADQPRRPRCCACSWRTRSAPLAYECFEADRIGLLRLHVRVDERTAGFLGLGLAKGYGAPVAVLTTSGTATANLHPAVLEAWHAHLPLIVITASRPRSVINTGANQTADQDQLFGDTCADTPRCPTRLLIIGPGASKWPGS